MTTYFNNHDFIRLWPDGSCTMLEVNGKDKFESVILQKDHADDIYNRWAASDSALSYFDYARLLGKGDDPEPKKGCPLTDEDAAIYARLWMQGGTPPFMMTIGDHRDADIMRILGECTEMHGGATCADDLNLIEEMSYIYHQGQTADDFDFDPIYNT